LVKKFALLGGEFAQV